MTEQTTIFNPECVTRLNGGLMALRQDGVGTAKSIRTLHKKFPA